MLKIHCVFAVIIAICDWNFAEIKLILLCLSVRAQKPCLMYFSSLIQLLKELLLLINVLYCTSYWSLSSDKFVCILIRLNSLASLIFEFVFFLTSCNFSLVMSFCCLSAHLRFLGPLTSSFISDSQLFIVKF